LKYFILHVTTALLLTVNRVCIRWRSWAPGS